MEFKVTTSAQAEVYYHGDSKYKVDNGVLHVVDEDQVVTLYGPTAWGRLTEDQRQEPFFA